MKDEGNMKKKPIHLKVMDLGKPWVLCQPEADPLDFDLIGRRGRVTCKKCIKIMKKSGLI